MAEAPKTNSLHDLLRAGTKQKVVRKQIMQSSADRQVVNVIISGYVKRYQINNDGSISVQIIYGPGDVFPLTVVYRKLLGQHLYIGPEVFYYEALCPTEVAGITEDELKSAVDDNSDIYSNLMQEAGEHLEWCVMRLENLALKTSYHRLAHHLWYLTSRFSTKKSTGIEIDLPLTHQDLADSLSLTRETVSMAMGELKSKKLIKTNKHILIPNIDKLKEEAYG
jgi:CRP-like cAMP-binding protein